MREIQSPTGLHYRIHESPEDLAVLTPQVAQESEIWIDTETADWNTRSPRLSLVQLRLGNGSIHVLDVLSPEMAAAYHSTFAPRVIAAPRITKWAHYARFERRILGADFVQGLHCTFELARRVPYHRLPLRSLRLAALVHHLHGTAVDKTLQRADWGQRPLSAEQLDYAAWDVHILPAERDASRWRAAMWDAIKAFMVSGSHTSASGRTTLVAWRRCERTLTERWTPAPLCVPEGEHFDATSRQSVVQEVVQAREVDAANPSQGGVPRWRTAPGLSRDDRECPRKIVSDSVGCTRPIRRPPTGDLLDLGSGAPAKDDRQRRSGHVLRRPSRSAARMTSPRSTSSIASRSCSSCSLGKEKDSSGLSTITVTVVPSMSETSPSGTILPSSTRPGNTRTGTVYILLTEYRLMGRKGRAQSANLQLRLRATARGPVAGRAACLRIRMDQPCMSRSSGT